MAPAKAENGNTVTFNDYHEQTASGSIGHGPKSSFPAPKVPNHLNGKNRGRSKIEKSFGKKIS